VFKYLASVTAVQFPELIKSMMCRFLTVEFQYVVDHDSLEGMIGLLLWQLSLA